MKKQNIITILIILLLLAAITSFVVITKKIPMNDLSVDGNTGGNLYNQGLFCEDDGTVYFSNPYDEGSMYSMNPDETKFKKLLSNNIKYINAGGNYLYYYQSSDNASANLGFAGRMVGVYRCKKNGTRVTCLKKDPSAVIHLVGNYIYYQHYTDVNHEGMTLYKTKIDRSSEEKLSDYIIDPSSAQNGNLYFYGSTGDYNLYQMSTPDDTISTLYTGKIYNPIADGDYVYFMNVSDNYKLYSYAINDGAVKKLTDDRVDTYNVTPDYIYYQKNGETDCALKRMRKDGSESEIIISGNYSELNATSQYLYFKEFDTDLPIYQTPVSGAVSVEEFVAAKEAVKK